jgi:hypothetical protein
LAGQIHRAVVDGRFGHARAHINALNHGDFL